MPFDRCMQAKQNDKKKNTKKLDGDREVKDYGASFVFLHL